MHKNASLPPALNRTLFLGVIGCGKISQIILPQLAALNVRVVALTDVNKSVADELAKKLEGAIVYPETASLLAATAVEAVLIATPPNTHRPLIRLALAAGKSVLCEKPFVLSADEARIVAEDATANTKSAVACCSSRFRHTPHARAATKLVAEGALGRLQRVRIFTSSPPPASIDHLPAWKRSAATAGGGLVADWGVYEFEWLRGTLGAAFDPVSVNAQLSYWRREGTDLESGYDVQISCHSGLEIYLTRQPGIGPKQEWITIRGEEGGLDLPFGPASRPGAARLYRAGDGVTDGVAITDTTGSWPEVLCGPVVDLGHALQLGTPVAAPAASQILVHQLIDAVLSSGRERRPVEITA